jgi:hypothetical protein
MIYGLHTSNRPSGPPPGRPEHSNVLMNVRMMFAHSPPPEIPAIHINRSSTSVEIGVAGVTLAIRGAAPNAAAVADAVSVIRRE